MNTARLNQGTPLLLNALGKLADVSAHLLERLWLRWNPAYHLKEASV